MTKLILFSFLTLLSSQVFAGDKVLNGGDICEDQIKIIRDDLKNWISNGGASDLQLPTETNVAQYNFKMTTAIEKARVRCTSKILRINGVEKTCINESGGARSSQILCNLSAFAIIDKSSKYVLIHHEYAGIAGIEKSQAEDSNYPISNQISNELTDVVEKRLAVKGSADSMFARVGRDSFGRVLIVDQATAIDFCSRRGKHLPSNQEIHDIWTGKGIPRSDLTPKDSDAMNALAGRAFLWTASPTDNNPQFGVLYSKEWDENGFGIMMDKVTSMHAFLCY